MSYYTTGSTFSLQSGTHLPRILYTNNGMTSGRLNGVIVPTDQINGLISTTSIYIKLAPPDITAERLGDNECYALLSNMSPSVPPIPPVPPFYVGIASYDNGYVATTRYKTYPFSPLPPEIPTVQFYTSHSQYSANVEGLILYSVDCSTDGSVIVGVCVKGSGNVLYYSTNSGISYNVTPSLSISNIFVKMTRAGDYFTISNPDTNILYFYKTSNMSRSDYTVPDDPFPFQKVSCLSMNLDGTQQYVFDNTGYALKLVVNTNLIGSGNPVTAIESNNLGPYIQEGYPVRWDSCAASVSDQMAVGFVNNTDCYIYTWNNWAFPAFTKLSGVNATESVSFMSSDGSKKWCIIAGQLYKFIVATQQFVLQPNVFVISTGTCNSSGDTVYLIDNTGNIWSSLNDAPFTKLTV